MTTADATWLALVSAEVIAVLGAGGHAVLHKRDHRAAVGWVALILALPILGALIYTVLGINRVQRKAQALYRGHTPLNPTPSMATLMATTSVAHPHRRELSQLVSRVAGRPLLTGNQVTPLQNGDAAYPAMLDAIATAERSVTLMSYIFDRDTIGRRFVAALGDAHDRGVAVRVLVDAVGARYSFPSIIGALRARGVLTARFNRTLLPWRWAFANLRNHRKILVCDGLVGFTGGMNIRDGHLVGADPKHPVTDLHFRVEGPVVSQMQAAFAEDWHFVTEEALSGERWFPDAELAGDTHARGIADGPDADFGALRWTILGAVQSAQRRVRIQSPYFLPEGDLIAALILAALRGVEIEIFVPGQNNQALVAWACDAILPQLLRRGCRVWKTAPPFDHTKLVIVDDDWVLLGSTNLDPRSLRLNFEYNLECYSSDLAGALHTLLDDKRVEARPVTLEGLTGAHILKRVRNGVARLFTPYL